MVYTDILLVLYIKKQTLKQLKKLNYNANALVEYIVQYTFFSLSVAKVD